MISPFGQQLIADAWQEAAADLELEITADAEVEKARAALFDHKDQRTSTMTTQEQVGWITDHFRALNAEQIAAAAGVSESLVSRYINIREAQRAALRRHLKSTSDCTWDGTNDDGERVSVTMPSLPSRGEAARLWGVSTQEPAIAA